MTDRWKHLLYQMLKFVNLILAICTTKSCDKRKHKHHMVPTNYNPIENRRNRDKFDTRSSNIHDRSLS